MPLRDYVYLNGEPVALRIYGAQFGTMYYFVNDHLGTPQKIVNASGNMVWQAVYQPFGEAQLRMAIVSCNLRFPGQYFDAESGLHYNWHRYYDPETGRYITADPIGLDGGINLYAYVMGNPVNRVDIEGKHPVIVVILFTAFVFFKNTDIANAPSATDVLYKSDADEEYKNDFFIVLGGRGKNRIRPCETAIGDHSVFKRDMISGKITNYRTYRLNENGSWSETFGFDAIGVPHTNKVTKQDIPTPHTHDPSAPGGVRSPVATEIPR